MESRTWSVAALLFTSGLCALVYQTVWMREFRLVIRRVHFATRLYSRSSGRPSASAARCSERSGHAGSPLGPLREIRVHHRRFAALSLPLLWVVRQTYLSMGGSVHLGLFAARSYDFALARLCWRSPHWRWAERCRRCPRCRTEFDTARRTSRSLRDEHAGRRRGNTPVDVLHA